MTGRLEESTRVVDLAVDTGELLCRIARALDDGEEPTGVAVELALLLLILATFGEEASLPWESGVRDGRVAAGCCAYEKDARKGEQRCGETDSSYHVR